MVDNNTWSAEYSPVDMRVVRLVVKNGVYSFLRSTLILFKNITVQSLYNGR